MHLKPSSVLRVGSLHSRSIAAAGSLQISTDTKTSSSGLKYNTMNHQTGFFITNTSSSQIKPLICIQRRSFQVNRAFPQYSVIGESSILTLKPIMPKFKSVSNDAISIQQKGRLLIELAPNNVGNQAGWNWDEKIGFAISVEEIGLLVSQLPHYGVTLSRRVAGDQSNGFNGKSYEMISSSSNETIEKVLTVLPGEGATVTFRMDYMKDGVGGKVPPAAATNESSSSAPLEVKVEAGEWEVISSIFKESIPHLLGWNKMMSIGVENSILNRDD